MSIQVRDVTKLYGEQKALDNVSFDIRKGEIAGLLGPNGAGKSTMMKIITCFIPPTKGNVSVCGFDIFDQSIEVRRKIGYLPEHNPLYLEMYVKEFLEFVAGIYKLGKNKHQRVDEMIEMVGLTKEYKKKIGALSKGYRQRVGIAQALIHNPEVLILDEPTSGLDPNQLEEIRSLIKTVGKTKTVILSTHIMQEVEAICEKVIIINNGKIVADESTEKLTHFNLNDSRFYIEFETEINVDILKKVEGVESIVKLSPTSFSIIARKGIDIRHQIFQQAIDHKWVVLTIRKEEERLEKIFQQLTKE